jgi:5-hydroxyisourate hydrolase-like protein (transthyretin family)
MNALEEAKYKTNLKVGAQIESNYLKFCEIKGIEPSFKKLGNNNKKIGELSIEQRAASIGINSTKNDLRTELSKSTADLCCQGLLYAQINHDSSFKESVSYTESTLNNYPDKKLVEVAAIVNRNCLSKKTQLLQFGVTDQTLDYHSELIYKFQALLVTPIKAINDKKGYTEYIKALLKENDEILDLIDIGINLLKGKYPDLYASYKSARKVIVTGKNYISLRAHILDSVTFEGIKGAKVTLTPNTEKNAMTPEEVKKNTKEKVTGVKGIFNIKSITEGVYNVVVTKKGYQTATYTITIAEGEMFELKVNLVRESTFLVI